MQEHRFLKPSWQQQSHEDGQAQNEAVTPGVNVSQGEAGESSRRHHSLGLPQHSTWRLQKKSRGRERAGTAHYRQSRL